MSVSYAYFSNKCRFCLHNGDLQHPPSKIWDLFKMITNIEITENDILPKNVCKICLNRLEDISLFIDRCRENDAFLKKIYEDVKEKENNIILIDKIYEDVKEQENNIILIDEKYEDVKEENNIILINKIYEDVKEQENNIILIDEKYEDVKEQENNIILIDLDNASDSNYDSVEVEGIFIKSDAANEENASFTDTKNKLTLDKDTTYECPKCFKKFPFAASLRRHVLTTHEGVKPFICNICDKGYNCKQSLDEHMNFHTGTIPYKCSYCGKGFMARSDHTSHIYRNHNPDIEKIPKHERKYTEKRVHLNLECEICGKIFTSRYGLSNHHLIHKGEKKFLCNFCGKKFITNASLEQHIRVHTGETVECKECGQRFKHRSSLSNHMTCKHVSEKSLNFPHCEGGKPHKGDNKPHKCNICEKIFAYQCNLNEHMRAHTGEKPFLCPICGKRLAQPQTLKVHMRLHTGETPYVCSVCEKGYRDRSNLRRHFNQYHMSDNKLEETVLTHDEQ